MIILKSKYLQMELKDDDKQDIIRRVEAGKPLPEKYRWLGAVEKVALSPETMPQ